MNLSLETFDADPPNNQRKTSCDSPPMYELPVLRNQSEKFHVGARTSAFGTYNQMFGCNYIIITNRQLR